MLRETIVWKQLRHDYILPFIGVDAVTMPGKYCLISPWMENGTVLHYLENHPHTDRLTCIREIVAAIDFIHNLDPKVIHGNIRGNNIIVNDKGHCCLADFGASIVVTTKVPSHSTMSQNSSRWLCPELQVYDPTTYVLDHLPGRDIYALGCTIIEVCGSYMHQCSGIHVPTTDIYSQRSLYLYSTCYCSSRHHNQRRSLSTA
ncbi:kinase-like protein [Armillaria gallica]|uniref:Kinase-like protein n=1 Tax=Armillaria gallica TaxID=47427 RepID=A0A2H3CQQ3_ARMGA|nr:kinase-like protein [Armillaria gallica]